PLPAKRISSRGSSLGAPEVAAGDSVCVAIIIAPFYPAYKALVHVTLLLRFPYVSALLCRRIERGADTLSAATGTLAGRAGRQAGYGSFSSLDTISANSRSKRRPMLVFRRVLALGIAFFVMVLATGAQVGSAPNPASQDQPFVFKSNLNLIMVPVVVRDK